MDILSEFDKCSKVMYVGDTGNCKIKRYRKHAQYNGDTSCVHDNEFQLILMLIA